MKILEYEQKLAEKHWDCRVFIEFAAAHRKLFNTWLDKEVAKLLEKDRQ